MFLTFQLLFPYALTTSFFTEYDPKLDSIYISYKDVLAARVKSYQSIKGQG